MIVLSSHNTLSVTHSDTASYTLNLTVLGKPWSCSSNSIVSDSLINTATSAFSAAKPKQLEMVNQVIKIDYIHMLRAFYIVKYNKFAFLVKNRLRQF